MTLHIHCDNLKQLCDGWNSKMLQRCITARECAVLRVGMHVVELNVNVHAQMVSSEKVNVRSAHHSTENSEEKTHELIK